MYRVTARVSFSMQFSYQLTHKLPNLLHQITEHPLFFFTIYNILVYISPSFPAALLKAMHHILPFPFKPAHSFKFLSHAQF